MLTAVLSDIHANLEALQAVLADLDSYRPDRVIVLGDVIGYGPDPRACLDRIFEVTDQVILGNHESNLIWPDPDMDVEADLQRWTEEQTRQSPHWDRLEAQARARGKNAASTLVEDGITFVHASAAAPVEQYVWPAHKSQYIIFNDQIDGRLGEFLAEFSTPIGFCGHTHAPAVLTAYGNRKIFDPYENSADWNRESTFIGPGHVFFVPDGGMELKQLGDAKLVINPGSVGQPRDGNRFASYAVYEPGRLIVNRVSYDFRKTQAKIAELPINEETKNYLLLRLERGK